LRPLGSGPYLEAEVAWAVAEESALSLDDILSRRIRIALEEPDRGASVAPRVAEIAAGPLGWSKAQAADAVKSFLAAAHAEFDIPA
jgi:glycerol-3-phosphate dehydrogenase